MGRRARTSTDQPAPRAARADIVDACSEAELERLPSERELRDADEAAPRHAAVSLLAARHPDRNADRALCDQERGVAFVFDGMGGYAGAERAAAIACGSIALRLHRLPEQADSEGRRAWLADALEHAKANIRHDVLPRPHLANQDTTAVGAVLVGEGEERRVLIANAGDSRVYHLSGDWVTPFTQDDDLFTATGRRPPVAVVAARALVDSATTRADLARLPLAQMLFDCRQKVARTLMIATEIEIVEQPVSAGDRLIVCSDGVHDNLAAPEIDDIVAAHRHASDDELARALCAAARERADDRAHLRAKDDDITAAVLPVT